MNSSGFFRLVGMARFELTTSCSQSRHSNRAELHPAHFLFESECKGTAFFLYDQIFSKKNAKKMQIVLFFFYIPFFFCNFACFLVCFAPLAKIYFL